MKQLSTQDKEEDDEDKNEVEEVGNTSMDKFVDKNE